MAQAFKLLICLACFTCSSLFAKGGVIKDGGGLVTCTRTIGNTQFLVTWSTDFFITGEGQTNIAKPWRTPSQTTAGIIIEQNWFPNFRKMIQAKLPSKAAEWFRQLQRQFEYDNQEKPTLFGWEQLPERDVPKLDDIQPEIVPSLPADCIDVELQLLILRNEYANGTIKYLYNKNIEQSGSPMSQLQNSFLIVHEWLWNFSRDPIAIREANRYIHSQEFYDQRPQDAVAKLRALGVNIQKFD